MKPYYYIVLALVVLALGSSFWVIPGGPEIALMYFKDKQYRLAREASKAHLTSDRLPVSVVKLLTELDLEFGDVNGAVALMERYVRQNPGNLEALQRLATYYQYAQRPQEYLATLEQINRLRPTEENLRELSSTYNFVGQYDKQIATLNNLLEDNTENPQDFLDLANLQASQGVVADAGETLKEFEALHPRVITDTTVELLVSLLLDTGKPDLAFARAVAWLSKQPNPETAARFSSLLHFKKQPALALRLLEPYEKIADNWPYLLAELIQVQIANGRENIAHARLKRLYSQGRLPDEVLESFLDLSLTRGESAMAFQVVQERGLILLPDWLLVNLAETAVSANRKDFTRQMLRELGEGFLGNHPVVAAELALAGDDESAGRRWIAQAEHATLSWEQQVALAHLYGKIGREQDAFNLLVRLASSEEVRDEVAGELAEYYLKMDKAREGLPLFERLRSRRPTPAIEAAWAVLATAAGQEEAVMAWLNTAKGTRLSNQFLTDLHFVASENNKPALALASAEQLYRRVGGRQERFWLADALVAAGRPLDALPHLRSLLPGSSEERDAYVSALSAARAKGAPVGDELRRYWTQELAQPGLREERKEEAVYALLDLDAYTTVLPTLAEWGRKKGDSWLYGYIDAAIKAGRKQELIAFLQEELDRKDLSNSTKEARLYTLIEYGGEAAALPYLRRFADASGSNWVFAYQDALEKLGRRDELLAYWKARAARTDLPASERRSMADRLLEAGQKRLSEQVLLDLARDASPDSPSVSQLLFLWGPRPAPAALEWLEGRARSSSGVAQAGWMNHLINAGAPRRAIAVVEGTTPPSDQDSAVLDAHLNALVAAKEGAKLSAVADRQIGLENNPQRLRRLARLGLELNQSGAAQKAYSKLLSLAPNDPEALKRLGMLASTEADYSLARQYFEIYLRSDVNDYESSYYYGESLLHAKDLAAARVRYELALRLIEGSPEKTFGMRLIRAHLLHRIGREEESLIAFEALTQERPNDKNLRADFAAVLLEQGRPAIAQRVLSTP